MQTTPDILADALADVEAASLAAVAAGPGLPMLAVTTAHVIRATYRISGDAERAARDLHALADAIRSDAGVDR